MLLLAACEEAICEATVPRGLVYGLLATPNAASGCRLPGTTGCQSAFHMVPASGYSISLPAITGCIPYGAVGAAISDAAGVAGAAGAAISDAAGAGAAGAAGAGAAGAAISSGAGAAGGAAGASAGAAGAAAGGAGAAARAAATRVLVLLAGATISAATGAACAAAGASAGAAISGAAGAAGAAGAGAAISDAAGASVAGESGTPIAWHSHLGRNSSGGVAGTPISSEAGAAAGAAGAAGHAFGGMTRGAGADLGLFAGSDHGWAFTQLLLSLHHLTIAEECVHIVAITMIYQASSEGGASASLRSAIIQRKQIYGGRTVPECSKH